jgi:hypothetical protein
LGVVALACAMGFVGIGCDEWLRQASGDGSSKGDGSSGDSSGQSQQQQQQQQQGSGGSAKSRDGDGLVGIAGTWKLDMERDDGAVYEKNMSMTLAEESDHDVTGTWKYGTVDGDIETDRDLKLNLRSGGVVFTLRGKLSSGHNSMDGSWDSNLAPPDDEGRWDADRL